MPGGLPCTSGGNVPLPLHGLQGRSFWSTPIPQHVEHRRRPDLGIGVLHIPSTRRFESAPNRACTCAAPGKIVPDRVITVPTTRSLCPTQVPPCATTKPSSRLRTSTPSLHLSRAGSEGTPEPLRLGMCQAGTTMYPAVASRALGCRLDDRIGTHY